MIPGDGFRAGTFQNFLHAFPQQGVHALAFDYLWNERAPTPENSVQDLCDILAHALPASASKIFLIGHSRGAKIISDYLQTPHDGVEISGAIFLGGTLGAEYDEPQFTGGLVWQLLTGAFWMLLPGVLGGTRGIRFSDEFARGRYLADQLSQEEYRATVAPLMTSTPFAILRADPTVDRTKIDVPLLVLYGGEDHVIIPMPETPEKHDWIRIVPGAPHNFMMAPNWRETAEIITDWIHERIASSK